MGTTLTGTTPQDTYDSLIKVTDNGPLSGTAKYLSDGLGNDSALAVSTAAVGIGTSSPAAALDVRSNSTIFRAGAISGAYVELSANQLSAKTSAGSASDLYLNLSGANTIINRDTGNVGIGTSSPTRKLDVDGVIRTQTSGAAGAPSIELGTSAQGNGLFYPAANTIAISTNDTERVRFLAGGGMTFNGDTAAANALDDYEEGTWTMGVSFGGASVGVTTANNTGTYTKIGRQVTVNGFLALSNKGSSTGAAKITGLPFTIPNNDANYSSASLRFDSITFTNQFQGIGVVNSTTINLEEITTLGAISSITDADFANNSSVIISLTYFV